MTANILVIGVSIIVAVWVVINNYTRRSLRSINNSREILQLRKITINALALQIWSALTCILPVVFHYKLSLYHVLIYLITAMFVLINTAEVQTTRETKEDRGDSYFRQNFTASNIGLFMGSLISVGMLISAAGPQRRLLKDPQSYAGPQIILIAMLALVFNNSVVNTSHPVNSSRAITTREVQAKTQIVLTGTLVTGVITWWQQR